MKSWNEIQKAATVIFIFASGLAPNLLAQTLVVKNVDNESFKEFTLNYDPSSVAVSNDHQSAYWPQPYLERWRIVTDLNGDGKDDLILSDTKDTFGNAGGGWLVYISSNGYWRCIGDVGLYPGAFTFDRVHDEVDLWYYSRSAAQEGHFGYYSFHSGGMRKGVNQIFIRTESEDEENVFMCVDKAIFGYAHKHPYRFETSETSTNGVVTWKHQGDWQKPERKNEIYELRQKLADAEKRASIAEARLQQMSHRLYEYEHSVHQLCGITLGSAWDGGEKNRPCEEIFSGFTNLTVSVDGNNFVESIRLTRNDVVTDSAARVIRGRFEPTDEEQKIIHQVENQFNIRFQPNSANGIYSWGGPISGTWIDIHFASEGESQSYIEMRYSRKLGK